MMKERPEIEFKEMDDMENVVLLKLDLPSS